MRALILSALLLVPLPALAGEPLLELDLVTGVATPVAGPYDKANDASLKVGLRAHHAFFARGDWRISAELATDWVDRNSQAWDSIGEETFRVRGQLGARLELDVGRDLGVYLRALGGVEYLWTGSIPLVSPGEPGSRSSFSQRVYAPAAELGAGVSWQIDRWSLGAQVSVPMAFHDDLQSARGLIVSGGVEDPVGGESVPNVLVYDTIVELDALLTLGASF